MNTVQMYFQLIYIIYTQKSAKLVKVKHYLFTSSANLKHSQCFMVGDQFHRRGRNCTYSFVFPLSLSLFYFYFKLVHVTHHGS